MKNKKNKLVTGLMLGLEAAGNEMFSQNHAITGGNIMQVKEVAGSLSEALQKGEITQEVKDLRYRMYKVLDGADKYYYNINDDGSLTYRSGKKPADLYEKDGEKLILLQDVPETFGNTNETLSLFGSGDDIRDVKFTEFNMHTSKTNYLTMKRAFKARYDLEKYVKKLALKQTDDGNYICELYITIYKDFIDNIQPMFINEIDKLYNNKKYNNDILEIETIEFLTFNPRYGQFNNTLYTLKVLSVESIIRLEEKGVYVLRYNIAPVTIGELLTNKYFEKDLEERYNNRVSRGSEFFLFSPPPREYHCEVCGKNMGELVEKDDETIQSSEKYDWMITKNDYGKGMCINCLKEFLDNKYK